MKVVVLEKSQYMGGLSRTVSYKGNRIDIGGHRFFSKSDRVIKWWLDMLPLQASGNGIAAIRYHGRQQNVEISGPSPDPGVTERVMLLRSRKSRIYFLRRLFDYPITLSKKTFANLGLWRTFKIIVSYARSVLFPLHDEKTLEQFFINRFGRELYITFFKSYTEKVWGVPCDHISAEWGVQRIKGLSAWRTLLHAFRIMFERRYKDGFQGNNETSLVERFLYPKLGSGQMWEECARRIKSLGGEVYTGYNVIRLITNGPQVSAVQALCTATGLNQTFSADYFFSTAPLQELLRSFDVAPPEHVLSVSDGLVYRNFITVGLLVKELKIRDQSSKGEKLIRDNWIYIQEPDVLLGRLQIFNNWSPYMVKDPSRVWLGLEYFCDESDRIWQMSDEEMTMLAKEEISKIGIVDASAFLDSTVVRVEKTYPAYSGSYNRFSEIRDYVDRYENLFLLGRNGLHRYNNQDHSMLTAMVAIDNIVAGRRDKSNIWDVNTELDYHEEKGSVSH